MKLTRFCLCGVVIWSSLVSGAGAITLTSGYGDDELASDSAPLVRDDRIFFLELGSQEESEILIEDDVVYADGSIFMEYGFFVDHIASGLELVAEGAVSILEDLDEATFPEFTGYDDELDVAWSESGALWITTYSMLNANNFVSGANIYIVDRALSSEVPLPASSVLFLSGLAGLLRLRRRSLVLPG